MPRPELSDRGRTFPRGLVLGLTMAEIAILIIFVLLLALAALLAHEAERREEAEGELVRFEQMETLFEEEALPEDPVVFKSVLRERVDEHEDADSWRELVREIERAFPEPSVQEVVERIQESAIGRMSPPDAEELLAAHRAVERADAHAELERALQAADISATAGELREMAEVMEAAARLGMSTDEIRDAIENRDAIETGRALEELLETNDGADGQEPLEQVVQDAKSWRDSSGSDSAALAKQLDRAQDRIERLEAQARARGGGGTDHPSCWYDRDGTVAYLFDVALTADGFVMDVAHAPQHEAKRELLPIDAVRTGVRLTQAAFLSQTRAVYQWSVERECRFFVRAFDLTAADQKDLYKRRMRVLESRFYKNANPTGALPAGLRLGAAR